jgi:hypothetical protein
VLADDGVQTGGRELKLSVGSSAPTPDEALKILIANEAAHIVEFRVICVGYAIAKNGTP